MAAVYGFLARGSPLSTTTMTLDDLHPNVLMDNSFAAHLFSVIPQPLSPPPNLQPPSPTDPPQQPDALLVLLPLLIVLSAFLFLLLLFLICVLLIRRRRGISLRDHDGPTDMSREELIHGEGGFEGVESRWLESVGESARREYLRAKGIFSLVSPSFVE